MDRNASATQVHFGSKAKTAKVPSALNGSGLPMKMAVISTAHSRLLTSLPLVPRHCADRHVKTKAHARSLLPGTSRASFPYLAAGGYSCRIQRKGSDSDIGSRTTGKRIDIRSPGLRRQDAWLGKKGVTCRLPSPTARPPDPRPIPPDPPPPLPPRPPPPRPPPPLGERITRPDGGTSVAVTDFKEAEMREASSKEDDGVLVGERRHVMRRISRTSRAVVEAIVVSVAVVSFAFLPSAVIW